MAGVSTSFSLTPTSIPKPQNLQTPLRNLLKFNVPKYPKKSTSIFSRMVASMSSSSRTMNTKFYKRVDPCLVIPPPNNNKPKAIIKFIGGAFIGAVPEVTYSYLLSKLAEEGYLVICVPYNVTFDHTEGCRRVFERYHSCFDSICESGLPESGLSGADIADLPLYSLGHSNGALLQVLTGSNFSEKLPKANVIMSYNNKSASEAVPYFEQLGPIVSQTVPFLEASPIYFITQNASGAWKSLFDTAETIIPNYDPEAVLSLTKFVDQLPSVFGELAQGISEFKPKPPENLECFKKSYNIERTLLVKFNFDTIDETDLLEETLQQRVESIGGKLEKVTLSGTHLTPCIPEPRWQVGSVYTPADAIAQGLKTVSLNDTKVLCRTIVDWLSNLE
ncbi:hypothetical protein Leryth_010499 [Lithospermum erythrorhizon]|nr:hypothetical protein Leryth_010499 [Lithospermum erythrorhizon]